MLVKETCSLASTGSGVAIDEQGPCPLLERPRPVSNAAKRRSPVAAAASCWGSVWGPQSRVTRHAYFVCKSSLKKLSPLPSLNIIGDAGRAVIENGVVETSLHRQRDYPTRFHLQAGHGRLCCCRPLHTKTEFTGALFLSSSAAIRSSSVP